MNDWNILLALFVGLIGCLCIFAVIWDYLDRS